MKDIVKDISFCGLYCGECPFHLGKIADLARDLRKELRANRFDKTAHTLSKIPFFAAFKKYTDCYDVLGLLVKIRCKKGCRSGGGDPHCKIRRCCEGKGYLGCWECNDIENCSKFDFLYNNHGDANKKNLRKLKRKGVDEFLVGKKHWYVSPKKKQYRVKKP